MTVDLPFKLSWKKLWLRGPKEPFLRLLGVVLHSKRLSTVSLNIHVEYLRLLDALMGSKKRIC